MLCTIVRVFTGCVLGSLLGMPLVFLGLPEQGAALAIVGGLGGTGLMLSATLYQTTVSASARRIFKGVCVVWAASFLHKIPGTGDAVQGLMASMRSQDAPLRDEKLRPERIKRAVVLQLVGVGVGALLGAIAGLALASFPLTKGGGNPSLGNSVGLVVFFTLCGVFWGPALSLLIMPGRHRELILMALVTGAAIGGAFGLSVYRSAVITPLNSFAFAIGLFEAVCLAACLCSKEMQGIE